MVIAEAPGVLAQPGINTTGHVPTAAVGVVLLAVAALAWSGRWNSWVHSWGLYAVIAVFPPLGACLVMYGLIPVALGPILAILAVLTLVWLVVGFGLWFAQPLWYGPKWLRDEVKARRRGDLPRPRRRK